MENQNNATMSIVKTKIVRKGAGRKKARIAAHFSGKSMTAFVSVVEKIEKTPMQLIALAAASGKKPVAGPLADGYFEVTRAGIVTLTTRKGMSDERSFSGTVEYVRANWREIAPGIDPVLVTTVTSTADTSGDESIDPLAFLDNMLGDDDDSEPEMEYGHASDDDADLPE